MEPIFMLTIGCVAGLSLSLSLLRRGREKKQGKRAGDRAASRALRDAARGLTELRPGDVVQHLGTDLLVERVEPLEGAGPWLCEYSLSDGSGRWLLLAAGAAAGDDEGAWLLREATTAAP